MKISDLTHALIRASEKAARIARTIRAEEDLFSLLIEEKPEIKRHDKVIQDFKTLADVLIQETIKHDLGKQFPGLEKFVYGEEESEFTNTNGETIHVRVCDTVEETCSLLAKVLEGNAKAPQLLARVVHEDVTLPDIEKISAVTQELPLNSVGIWIDPIDSTAQYIAGIEDASPENGVYSKGVQCVTVLIGAYDRESGIPIIGALNQPFSNQDVITKRWNGRIVWGISYKSTNINSYQNPESMSQPALQSNAVDETSSTQSKKMKMSHLTQSNSNQEEPVPREKLISSTSELPDILAKFSTKFQVVHGSGSGYKSLSLLDNVVATYSCSSGSTYKWDTCCSHAILRSLGGSVLDFHKAWEVVKSCKDTGQLEVELRKTELTYHHKEVQKQLGAKQWANAGGIVAYRDIQIVLKLLQCLC
ncbi:inositol polyphosphate 1-phosphatase [Lingula anatina]|uniref:Inositol polyphosphate 1-phosphatase n=1 Tax=Lingula anatina TaxID=7574 RepID=A0A1S3I229_LINAN|nr:inositol polyphosphate 1-phosphatase [Lingula anatina]|eukprot:XP_013391886.1 inositol polyphosphate 1-phosphatase [Lingula anatina]